jgi:hypothetical protein
VEHACPHLVGMAMAQIEALQLAFNSQWELYSSPLQMDVKQRGQPVRFGLGRDPFPFPQLSRGLGYLVVMHRMAFSAGAASQKPGDNVIAHW